MTPRTDTHHDAIRPGTVIGGYRVHAPAGRGELGEVYRARGPEGDVALELISPWPAADPGFRARLRREAELAAGLAHPNVVPVHRAGEDAGRLYLALGWVDGTDLAARVEREGPLAPAAAARVVADVAAALDAAHAHGLVHRDVAPRNVIVGDRAWLTGFGLATSAAGGSRTGQFFSSAGYVAPEQVRGEPVGPATDVYALGGVLLFALSGLPPFPEESDLATMEAHVAAPPPAASARVPGLPPALDAVLAHALAKAPAGRYPSAGAFAAAVAGALAGEDAAALAPARPLRRAAGAAARCLPAPLRLGRPGSRPRPCLRPAETRPDAPRAARPRTARRAPPLPPSPPRRASPPPSPPAAAPPA